MVINGYSGEKGLQEAIDQSTVLLKKYAGLTTYDVNLIS